MAADAVDAAVKVAGIPARPSATASMTLSGAASRREVVSDVDIPSTQLDRLYGRYGRHASEVLDLIRAEPELGELLHPALPYLRAEAEYAIRSEAAATMSDVLSRRLRAAVTNPAAAKASEAWVAERLR
jgi:glycerol-3-phosphate dehydrogenase